MSAADKETQVYATITSDRHPDHKPYAGADHQIAAHLVVAHGIDATVQVRDDGYLWLTIEHQERPGVPLRKFRYALSIDAWDEL